LNAHAIPEDVAAALQHKLIRRPDATTTILWVYAAATINGTTGKFQENGLAKTFPAVRGFFDGLKRFAGAPTQLTTQLVVHKNTQQQQQQQQFGAGCPVAPAFYWTPPPANIGLSSDLDPEVLGRYTEGGLKGKISVVRAGKSKQVFSGTPALPHTLLREIAQTAGVHIYVDSGSSVGGGMVDIMGNTVVVHAGAAAGVRRVTLPGPAVPTVEAEDGSIVCSNCTNFATKALRAGSSAVFFLKASSS
jgi:hypothetical protein